MNSNQINQLKGYAHRMFAEFIIIATSNKELLKQHLKTPLYQNAYNLIAGSAITSVLGFAFWILAARLYSAEAVGLASAALSALGLIALLSELGLGIGLIRFLPGAGQNSNAMLNTCLTLSGAISIIIALIFLAGLGFWSPALLPLRQSLVFSMSFVVFAVLLALQPLVANTFLARRNTRFIVYTSLLNHLLSLALIVVFVFFINSAYGIITSSGLASACTLTIALVLFLPNVQTNYRFFLTIRKWVIGELGFYSLGNYIGRLLLQVTNLILPLIVINTLGEEKSAYFFVAWTIANTLRVIPSSISNSLFAEISNEEVSLRANTKKSLKLMLLLMIPTIFLIAIIAPVLLLLFGQSYSDHGTLLLIVAVLSIIPWGINYLYISISRLRKSTGGIITVAGISTGLSLSMSYFLMLKMDLVGVGLGYFAGQSIVATGVAIYLWRSYHSNTGLLGSAE